MAEVLIVIPTYNESENLPLIAHAALEALPEAHLLVVDDNSPDGTGRIADQLAAADARVSVLHREGKGGLGRAYLAGFKWALEREYRYVFEMDADFSHQPRYLPVMLQAAQEGADLVVGSRYVKGGGTQGWGWQRKLISRGGGLYSRAVLGLKVHDVTAGFACYRRRTLEALELDQVFSMGFGFQVEMKYRTQRKGFSIVEVPIVFPDRTRGASKMSGRIFKEALVGVWRMKLRVP